MQSQKVNKDVLSPQAGIAHPLGENPIIIINCIYLQDVWCFGGIPCDNYQSLCCIYLQDVQCFWDMLCF